MVLLVINEKVTFMSGGSYISVVLASSGKIRLHLAIQRQAWLRAAHGKTVTWIGDSIDQTILKLELGESLLNAQNLVGATTICANKHQILLLPTPTYSTKMHLFLTVT